jgi:hypothetical protein
MLEALAEFAHLAIQLLLTSMGEWRMTYVMDQRQRFGQILIQFQNRRDGTGNLRNFDGVSQAIPEMVRDTTGENLGFVLQTSEGSRVNDAVAIALELVSIGVRQFRVAAAVAALNRKAEGA